MHKLMSPNKLELALLFVVAGGLETLCSIDWLDSWGKVILSLKLLDDMADKIFWMMRVMKICHVEFFNLIKIRIWICLYKWNQ